MVGACGGDDGERAGTDAASPSSRALVPASREAEFEREAHLCDRIDEDAALTPTGATTLARHTANVKLQIDAMGD